MDGSAKEEALAGDEHPRYEFALDGQVTKGGERASEEDQEDLVSGFRGDGDVKGGERRERVRRGRRLEIEALGLLGPFGIDRKLRKFLPICSCDTALRLRWLDVVHCRGCTTLAEDLRGVVEEEPFEEELQGRLFECAAVYECKRFNACAEGSERPEWTSDKLGRHHAIDEGEGAKVVEEGWDEGHEPKKASGVVFGVVRP